MEEFLMSELAARPNEWSDAFTQQVTDWRRHLHQHPELSFQETETARYVEDVLQSFGSLLITRPTPTSVVARLIGSEPGPILALRADMDALPIQEENDLPYASDRPGVMHACGHDGHTAMLLGVAKLLTLRAGKLHGEVRFLFQHAEELPPGGARELVEAGVMDGVDWVIGSHLSSKLETGKIGIAYGPMMASPDTFRIVVKGKGGHAASPHLAIDPIAIGSQIVTNLQHIVSRTLDPLERLVISVTQFASGTAHNVIPGTAALGGTVRSFSPELRSEVPEQMRRIVKGITEAHGADFTFEYELGYAPVINEANLTRVVEEAAQELFGADAVVASAPNMGGEDFSAYQQKAPGTFFNIGSGRADKESDYPHHHPRFTIDEDALANGVLVFLRSVDKLLKWT
jgi:amidohydrolase